MPDTRQHRGPHPEDVRLFARDQWPALRCAVADLSWLLSRGYAEKSALKLVGDRFALRERQRTAVMRCACSDTALHDRTARQIPGDALRGASLLIDGYNVLTTMEAALGGGVILHARDGCYRDMASMHGSYRKVAETIPALEHLADALLALGASHATWLLDAPVSNSGRLRQVMQELAAARGWDFTIEIVPDPDAVLTRSEEIVATADAAILDRCGRWFNLARYAVDRAGLTKSVVDLRDVSE